MEVFVARQPVFDREKNVYAYELLYRENEINAFPHVDADRATADVIINSYLNIGLDRLSEGKPCFINFTDNLLQREFPTYCKQSDIIIEIEYTIGSDQLLIENCKKLQKETYQISLDGFVYNAEISTLSQLFLHIDMVKVDFIESTKEQRKRIESLAKAFGVKLIAEKIETLESYEEAILEGYHFFQGYYLQEPDIISTYEIPTVFPSFYEDIQHKSLEELNVNELTNLLESDLSLSIKMLKLINSSSIGKNMKISSLRQAISFLGVIEIKKWISVLAERNSCSERNPFSQKLVSLTLTRAKLCEAIAGQIGNEVSPYFITGLFSTMENIVSRSMEEVIADLPLREEIHDALLGKENQLKEVLDLVSAVEQAQWSEIKAKCEILNINERELFRSYAESLKWSTDMLQLEHGIALERSYV